MAMFFFTVAMIADGGRPEAYRGSPNDFRHNWSGLARARPEFVRSSARVAGDRGSHRRKTGAAHAISELIIRYAARALEPAPRGHAQLAGARPAAHGLECGRR